MAQDETIENGQPKTTNEPLIGSSKRKRKSTIIKRNVSSDVKQELTENTEGDEQISPKSKKSSVQNKKKNEEKQKTESRKSKRIATNRKTKEEKVEAGDSEETNASWKATDDDKPLKQIKDEILEKKNRYYCDFCRKLDVVVGLPTKDKLEKHITKFHTEMKEEEQRFICRYCDKPMWFPTKKRLTYHVSSRHPGVIEFVCEICTTSFKLKANYKLHIKSHNITPKKKFTCDRCGGSFVNKAGFESHKKRFPGPHFKKKCQHCDFSFSKESHLKNHRCKILLVEEAEKARLAVEEKQKQQETVSVQQQQQQLTKQETTYEITTIKPVEHSEQVVIQTQENVYYRPITVHRQDGEESVLLQEYHEGAAVSDKDDHTIIIRDCVGDVNSSQIFQAVSITDLETQTDDSQQQVFHVNVADWNVVAPYVIKEDAKFT